jgi:glycosyltransferase involved in cell wall biosynthesis
VAAHKLSEARLDVVIPVLNEAHVLESSVVTLRAFLSQRLPCRWRIVVADNGSKDGTWEVAKKLEASYPDVACFHLDERGRGRALRHAWTQGTASIFCYMDVDLSTELGALPRALEALLEEGFDIATGSRLMRDSRIRRSVKREIVSRIYNLIVKRTFATRFSDAQCGFKAVTRKVIEHIVPQIKDQSWFFDTELLVLAEKQGYRIKDIPVVWIEDADSRVKIVKTAWDDLKGIWRLRWFLWSEEFARVASSSARATATPVSPSAAASTWAGDSARLPTSVFHEPRVRS